MGWIAKIRKNMDRSLEWVRQKVPFGLRTLLGLLLMIGGVFGFLPILGFWMIPFGIAIIGIDVAALRGKR